MKNILTLSLITLICMACSSKKEKLDITIDDGQVYLIIGSYSDGKTPGISVYNFDMQTGSFEYASHLEDVINPSYLVVSPDEKFVYSVNETATGAVSSFTFDKISRTLSPVNSQLTEGADPCYININREQTALVTANYTGGSISVFPIGRDGSISPLSQHINFTPESHIHTAVFTPDGKQLLATDLGKDKIYMFDVVYTVKDMYLVQEQNSTAFLEPGSGPRHLAFHPARNFVYCINELSGKITVFHYEDDLLLPIQYIASDTTPGIGNKGSADIHLTPDGRFLYSSNRLAAEGIAVFSVDQQKGTLTKIGYQPTDAHPRNFVITPNGKFLLCANRQDNTIQIFKMDGVTGLLKNTGREIEVQQPVCLKWIRK